MKRDDIIRMAREAGMTGLDSGGLLENFERFAALVAAADRKPLTDESIHDCFQQKHKDKTTERRMIARAIERAHGIGGEE